ncbi:MAG: GNAT family N-acetyltransferase [Verrucomicrobiales bacterium]
MNTHFLSDATIDAYLKDLLDRLRLMGQPPDAICAVTSSGVQLLGRLTNLIAAENSCPLRSAVTLSFGKTAGSKLHVTGAPEEELKNKRCLLIDSAVHTGRLMNRCRRFLIERDAAEITSYGLVVKRGSRHVPTFWGMMIDDLDRAIFCLETIPNNRLLAGDAAGQHHVCMSVLDEVSVRSPLLKTDVDSIDRVTWSDRLFAMQSASKDRGVRTYVLEHAHGIIGLLSVHQEPHTGILVVDEVALDNAWKRKKLGGVLMRFALTLARHHDCRKVLLNAIENQVGFYRKLRFEEVPGADKLHLDEETYIAMHKAIIHEPEDGFDPEV